MMMIGLLLSFLKWIMIIAGVLLLAGIAYEQFSRYRLEKKFLAGKTFAEINGHPLHYVKKGSGNCTVVFQSGMGSSHYIWKELQDRLAPFAVTIAYDRNGLMFSESAGLPVTNKNVSDELEQLLEKTGCPKPYILVGHSMAGIYLRPFIEQHKKDIRAIILAEAAHPEQLARSSKAFIAALKPPPRWLIDFVIKTGIYRAYFSFKPLSPEIPLDHPLHIIEKDFFYRSYNTTLEEVDNDELNFRDAANYKNFDPIPLTVITGTSDIHYEAFKDEAIKAEYKRLVNELQAELLNLSTHSRHIKAPNSGHILQVNDVDLLVNEIRFYVDQRVDR
jgi:pimeloyl-ACP methyl ester carboxylesterase